MRFARSPGTFLVERPKALRIFVMAASLGHVREFASPAGQAVSFAERCFNAPISPRDWPDRFAYLGLRRNRRRQPAAASEEARPLCRPFLDVFSQRFDFAQLDGSTPPRKQRTALPA